MSKEAYTEQELKGIEGAKRYLERRGWEVLTVEPFECEAGRIEIVAKDEDRGGLVFTQVCVKSSAEGSQPVRKADEKMRATLEAIAVAFLEGYEDVGHGLFFDALDITVLSSDKAMLRHQFNIL